MYKWCLVPACKNTSIKTPEKLFVSVPKKPKIRKKWLQLAGRNPYTIANDSTVFLCEDHFEMEKDMANYFMYKMGFTHQILMVDGVLPSKFHCHQQDPKKRMCDASTSRPGFVKRQRIQLIQECQDIQPTVTMQDVSVTPITKGLQNNGRDMKSEAAEDVKERWEIPVKTEPELDLEVSEELLQIKEEPVDPDARERCEIPIKTEPELDLDVPEELLQIKEEGGEDLYQEEGGYSKVDEGMSPGSEESRDILHPAGNSAEFVSPLAQSEDRRFSCKNCEYRTAEFSILKEHILAREGNKCPTSCPDCTFSCGQSSSLKAHILIVHGDTRALFCPHCDFRCAQPSALKWHIHASHESKRRYSCPHCDYTCTWASRFKSHILGHHRQTALLLSTL